MNRRHFLSAAAAASLSSWRLSRFEAAPGRLSARPHPPKLTLAAGMTSLGLATDRDTQILVPASYRADKPAPLIVGLHGATQDNSVIWRILQAQAESHGAIVLAPNSRGATWDLVREGFGADETLIDKALAWTFDRCNVDPRRIAIAGFSDGASAAISLGLINGDLFPKIMAFSPGFYVGDERHGKPSIFISHGTRDQILPIDQTSRRIVPVLQRAGFNVSYHEFDGPHTAPPAMVAQAMNWLLEIDKR
jgi:phospholipase/carboxylesterase